MVTSSTQDTLRSSTKAAPRRDPGEYRSMDSSEALRVRAHLTDVTPSPPLPSLECELRVSPGPRDGEVFPSASRMSDASPSPATSAPRAAARLRIVPGSSSPPPPEASKRPPPPPRACVPVEAISSRNTDVPGSPPRLPSDAAVKPPPIPFAVLMPPVTRLRRERRLSSILAAGVFAAAAFSRASRALRCGELSRDERRSTGSGDGVRELLPPRLLNRPRPPRASPTIFARSVISSTASPTREPEPDGDIPEPFSARRFAAERRVERRRRRV